MFMSVKPNPPSQLLPSIIKASETKTQGPSEKFSETRRRKTAVLHQHRGPVEDEDEHGGLEQ